VAFEVALADKEHCLVHHRHVYREVFFRLHGHDSIASTHFDVIGKVDRQMIAVRIAQDEFGRAIESRDSA